jgi:calcineurin-like phosphoesterase family protein
MPDIRVRIAQISDLHINRKNDDNVIGMLKTILRKVHPQVLIISGDLANQPMFWQMKKAARIVQEIQESCNPARLLVMPGNHDYKAWGNVGLRRLTRIPFEVYFRRNGLGMSWGTRVGLIVRLALNSLYWKGKDMREPLIVDLFLDRPDFGLAVFLINSNTLTEMMAAGKVEPPDLQELYRRFDQMENSPASRFLYKIAVVHHHPAPIADAPSDAISRIQDSFMIFYNAGLFVRELSRRGFNLVLHGHKHVAGLLSISCEFPNQGRTVLPIAAAGSAAHPHPDDSRGHHLNIIDIFDDDTSRLESRFFTADTESRDGATCTYDLSTLSDIRRRRYDVFKRVQKYSTREVRKTVSITNEGYSTVDIEILGNRIFPLDGMSEIPLSLTTGRPSYLRGVEIGRCSSQSIRIQNGQEGLYQFKGKIDLGGVRTPGDGPFNYGYSYRLMNGHALTAEEFARHYSGLSQQAEYASVTCDGACDLLTLTVKFPMKYDLESLEFDACAGYVTAPLRGTDDDRLDWGDCRDHPFETSRINGNIRPEHNGRTLICPDPLPGVIYKLQWRFRKPSSNARPSLAAIQKCAAAKERLLALPRPLNQEAKDRWNRARAILDTLARDLASSVQIAESLKIGVMVFNEASNRLRTVCSNTEPEDIPTGEFASGEGCAGYVFEQTRYLLYHRERDPIGYFIQPREWPEVPRMANAVVLASFPWIYSPGAGQPLLVLGVVNVCSFEPDTELLTLFDLPEEKCIAAMKTMQGLVNLACGQLFTI